MNLLRFQNLTCNLIYKRTHISQNLMYIRPRISPNCDLASLLCLARSSGCANAQLLRQSAWREPDIQLSLGNIHLLFFMLRCQICKNSREFCIFGKGCGTVQICKMFRKLCIFGHGFSEIESQSPHFRSPHMQICNICWKLCIFAPSHVPCQIYKIF